MPIELKGKWPVQQGDEITSALFEDLRKIIWGWRFGYNHPNLQSALTVWTDTGEYIAGDVVFHIDAMYTCTKPYVRSPQNNMPIPKGSEPGKSSWWVKTARPWRYADFYPNSGCYVVHWRAQSEVWVKTLAFKELPPCLNKFAQPVGAMSRKINGVTETPVQLALYYDRSEEILSGFIGTQYVEYHSVSGYSVPSPWYYPYLVFQGTAIKDDPYEDLKLVKGGYQAAIERLFESTPFSYDTPDGFFSGLEDTWVPSEFSYYIAYSSTVIVNEMRYLCIESHIANSSNKPPNATYWKEDVPAYTLLNHPCWRSNRSAFEAALKILGQDHYDWYLDTYYPPDPDMGRFLGTPRVLGCWRKMWKYTTGYPLSSMVDVNGVSTPIVWPSEMGDPPFLDQNEEWWYEKQNVSSALETAINRFNIYRKNQTDEITAFRQRHEHTGQHWFDLESSQYLEKNIAPNESNIVQYRTQRGYYAAYYEIHHQMINDMFLLLAICAKNISPGITVDGYAVQRHSNLKNAIRQELPTGDVYRYYSKFNKARSGAMNFHTDYTEYITGPVNQVYLGYGCSTQSSRGWITKYNTHLWVRGDGWDPEDYYPPTTSDPKTFFDGSGAIDQFRMVKHFFALKLSVNGLGISSEDLDDIIGAGTIDCINAAVIIAGAAVFNEPDNEPPTDSATMKYNYHTVKVGDPATGLYLTGGSYTEKSSTNATFQVGLFDEDEGYYFVEDLNQDAWPEEWITPPPSDDFGDSGASCFAGVLEFEIRSEEVALTINITDNLSLGPGVLD